MRYTRCTGRFGASLRGRPTGRARGSSIGSDTRSSPKLTARAGAGISRATITVCHVPPGTSKWNKVEHRLFSFISMNWRGRPLLSYEAAVKLIGGTTTKSGLRVKALLDTAQYAPGEKIPDEAMQALRLKPHAFHGDWNYTIEPRRVA